MPKRESSGPQPTRQRKPSQSAGRHNASSVNKKQNDNKKKKPVHFNLRQHGPAAVAAAAARDRNAQKKRTQHGYSQMRKHIGSKDERKKSFYDEVFFGNGGEEDVRAVVDARADAEMRLAGESDSERSDVDNVDIVDGDYGIKQRQRRREQVNLAAASGAALSSDSDDAAAEGVDTARGQRARLATRRVSGRDLHGLGGSSDEDDYDSRGRNRGRGRNAYGGNDDGSSSSDVDEAEDERRRSVLQARASGAAQGSTAGNRARPQQARFDPFFKEKQSFAEKKAEAERRRAEVEARRAQNRERQRERHKTRGKLMQRTKSGQPVMRHQINHLLAKIEKSIQEDR